MIMTNATKCIDLSYRTATGSRRIRKLFTPAGTFFFGLVGLLFVAAVLTVDQQIGLTAPLPGRLFIVLSLPPFTIPLIMIGWSIHHFLEANGTRPPSIYTLPLVHSS
jgi:vacuolar-type H+-ATPase subunit I/STV1